jgi:sulfate adenylyltransferase subunit 2
MKKLTKLDQLESKSIYIIREAYSRFKKLGMLWSIGKDSTTLLWLTKKAFFGRVPFPVIYIDTTKHFQEMYDFRDKCVKKWNLDLIISHNKEADRLGIGPKDKLKCCGMRKTEALKQTIDKYGFEALLLGIRSDEHGVRAKERTFSPRNRDFQWDYKNQAPELWDQYKSQKETEQHLRVHPILHWTEVDIWRYIKQEKLPVNPLYFAKDGLRYRSLGCQPCTSPVKSTAKNIDEIIKEVEESKVAERSGRAQDKEEANAMQKLRALGYMAWVGLLVIPFSDVLLNVLL